MGHAFRRLWSPESRAIEPESGPMIPIELWRLGRSQGSSRGLCSEFSTKMPVSSFVSAAVNERRARST